MKLLRKILIIFFISCNIFSNQKKILILSSTGGGGHTAAANAIKSYLKSNYEVKVINPIEDLFNKIDPVNRFSFGIFKMPKFLCAENLYNYLLQNNEFELINLLSKIGKKEVESNKKELTKLLKDYIQENKVHLIISVIPYINNIVLNLAKDLSIPFIVNPTDLDDNLFSYNIDNTQLKYEKFVYNIPFDHPLLTRKLNDKNFKIPLQNIRFLGYPLRSDFFEHKNVSQIKSKFSVSDDKTVIMIMMGAVGSEQIMNVTNQLADLKESVHLIICIGKNEELRSKINAINFGKNVSVSIVGFTNEISDLMYISDLIITKSGTHSVVESIQSNKLILLSLTDINWEQLNGKFISELGCGEVIKSIHSIKQQVSNLLKSSKKDVSHINSRDFGTSLNQIVNSLLS